MQTVKIRANSRRNQFTCTYLTTRLQYTSGNFLKSPLTTQSRQLKKTGFQWVNRTWWWVIWKWAWFWGRERIGENWAFRIFQKTEWASNAKLTFLPLKVPEAVSWRGMLVLDLWDQIKNILKQTKILLYPNQGYLTFPAYFWRFWRLGRTRLRNINLDCWSIT